MEPATIVDLSGHSASSDVNFLRLPAELLFNIYSDWLDPLRVSRLDCAICSRQYRQEWLEYLKRRHILKTVQLSGFKSSSYVSWLGSRCVRALGLELVKPNIDDVEYVSALDTWLKHCGPTLKSVTLHGCHDHVVQYTQKYCTNLRKLEIKEILSLDSYWDLLRANHNLTELIITLRYDCSFCEVIPDDILLSSVLLLSVNMRLFNSDTLYFQFLSIFPSVECLIMYEYELFSSIAGQLDKRMLIEILSTVKDVYLR